MTGKIKAAGLLLLAGLVLVAFAASSGFAGEEEEQNKKKRFSTEVATEVNPALLTGVQAEITTSFTNPKRETVCNSAHLAGQMPAKDLTQLTMTPTYKECKTGEFTTDFEFNGCDYLFTLKAGTYKTTEGTHTQGPMHIKCPPGKSIVIRATSGGATFCTITVPEQTPKQPEVDQKNVGVGLKGEILLTYTVKEVDYVVTGGFGYCGETGKTLTDGTIHSAILVAAYESAGGVKGNQQGLRVTGELAPLP